MDAYVKNEASANRFMILVLLLAAFLLAMVMLGFATDLFYVSHDVNHMTLAILSLAVFFLITPLTSIRSDRLSKPWFKYYILLHFIIAVTIVNIVIPKHGALGWAVCIALVAHYYNPRICKLIFVVSLVLMLVCLTLGLFYGEYDPNLMSGQLDYATDMIHNYLLPNEYPDTPAGRMQYLLDLRDAGDNRFFVISAAYYGGRVVFITLMFVTVTFLNKRTKILLSNEIEASNMVEKSRMELNVAKHIQQETLPETKLSVKDIEIVAEQNAAKEVGGDLYDYLDIDKDHFAFLIGDVSGKGIPAAMFMMKTITAFRDHARAGKSPSQILTDINMSIMKGNTATMFVTCFLAILDKRDGKIVYANAGHNPPIIGSDGDYHCLKCNPGLLLGCFEKTFVMDEYIVLRPGESITLYTDGITEARNSDGDFFGEDRLLQAMNRKNHDTVAELFDSINQELDGFVSGATQSDDITLITVKYHGNSNSFEERSFDARLENIPNMLDFIEDFSDMHNFPEEFKKQIVIVGDELFSNIIKYGYGNSGGDISVRLSFDIGGNKYVMVITDHAPPFNQLEVNNRTYKQGDIDLHVGGLGLIIVKCIMDECSYEYKGGKNILNLKKRF